MPYEPHFHLSPPQADSYLWRYIDFTTFVGMLDTNTMFFRNLCHFDDAYEGVVTPLSLQDIHHVSVGETDRMPDEEIREYHLQIRNALRKQFFVNCWHDSRHESVAMWRVYLKSNEGVAIRSTGQRLEKAFGLEPHSVNIGRVTYIDYETKGVPNGNAFIPVIHKRECFRYENEVRAIYWDVIKGFPDILKYQPPSGVMVRVDLSTLIESVWIAPGNGPWFERLVRSILEKYGVKAEVRRSQVDHKPEFLAPLTTPG